MSCLFPTSAGLVQIWTWSILTVKGLLLDLHADLTDHRDCHPKPSLKLVTENLETNITEKSEYFADTPPRRPYSKASRTNDRSQSFKSEHTGNRE